MNHLQQALIASLSVWTLSVSAAAQTKAVVLEEKEIVKSGLPNGVLVLPDWDHQPLPVLSIAEGKLKKNPFWDEEPQPKSNDEIYRRIQKEQTGDLAYDDAKGGNIVIWSQQVQSLGSGSLMELPDRIDAKLEQKPSIRVEPGARHLIKTIDGKYALFRVLDPVAKGQRIQWIYQPDGTASFAGKRRALLDRELGNVEVVHRNMRSVVDYFRNRLQIRVCFETLGEPASSEPHSLIVKDATVRSLLDAAIRAYPPYVWQYVPDTDIICVMPKAGGRLSFKPLPRPAPESFRDASWIAIVKSLNLRERGVAFPAIVAMGHDIRLPPDRKISIDVSPQDEAWLILARICWTYGEGLYFDVPAALAEAKGEAMLLFLVPYQ